LPYVFVLLFILIIGFTVVWITQQNLAPDEPLQSVAEEGVSQPTMTPEPTPEPYPEQSPEVPPEPSTEPSQESSPDESPEPAQEESTELSPEESPEPSEETTEPPPEPLPETPEQTPEPSENPFSEAELLRHAQSVYYSIYFFNQGELYSNDASPRMSAASVIKVFIMYYAYEQIAQGVLSESDHIAGQTVRRLIELMIQHSDNTATNTLITHFGMDTISQFVFEQGYTDTVLQRRMLDMQARAAGRDNYTSTRDSLAFLMRLYENREVFPYNVMLEIMRGQAVRTKIPLLLPVGTVVANKTGELHDVENDIGLVFTENGTFAIVVLTSGVRDTASARREIGRMALLAYEHTGS
jgi:beta-lactamase class A